MCPSLTEIGSKTAEKNSAQTNRQTDRHYENNGHLAVNRKHNMNTHPNYACLIKFLTFYFALYEYADFYD